MGCDRSFASVVACVRCDFEMVIIWGIYESSAVLPPDGYYPHLAWFRDHDGCQWPSLRLQSPLPRQVASRKDEHGIVPYPTVCPNVT